MSDQKEIPAVILGIIEEPFGAGSIVILLDEANNQILPVVIGEIETRGIIISANKIKTPRPLTHQLLVNVISNFQGSLEKIVIDRLENNTFYASLFIKKESQLLQIDARPSDAIALALETSAPIHVSEDVFKKAGRPNPLPTGEKKASRSPILSETKQVELTTEEMQKLKIMLEDVRKKEEQGNQHN